MNRRDDALLVLGISIPWAPMGQWCHFLHWLSVSRGPEVKAWNQLQRYGEKCTSFFGRSSKSGLKTSMFMIVPVPLGSWHDYALSIGPNWDARAAILVINNHNAHDHLFNQLSALSFNRNSPSISINWIISCNFNHCLNFVVFTQCEGEGPKGRMMRNGSIRSTLQGHDPRDQASIGFQASMILP